VQVMFALRLSVCDVVSGPGPLDKYFLKFGVASFH